MNRREKMLAAAVGALIVILVLNFGMNAIAKMFTQRNEQIEDLNEDIKQMTYARHQGLKARKLLEIYEGRSLPSNPVLANSRYRAWLHEWVEAAGISRENVKHVFARRHRDAYDQHTFTVICAGDLRQMVQLLFSFYSTDYLHRIKSLSARPLEGKMLSLSFTIEAVAMPGAKEDKDLEDMPSQRLAFDNLQDYLDTIVARNPYSPANQPPIIASVSTQTAFLGERMSCSLKASDPEQHDLSYRLDGNQYDGAEISESSGRFEWTPQEKGEFEFTVVVSDNGLPSKEISETFRVAVTDKPEVQTVEVRPSFDAARYTFVTGIVEVNGRWQVWLTSRTDGRWMRLFEGETFQIGTLDGTIDRIQPRRVEIVSGSTRLSVRYGQSIADGDIMDEGDVAAARN